MPLNMPAYPGGYQNGYSTLTVPAVRNRYGTYEDGYYPPVYVTIEVHGRGNSRNVKTAEIAAAVAALGA